MDEIELRDGYSLCTDDDGDWWLIPPDHVKLVSVPGEAYLIGTCDEKTACADAERVIAQYEARV